MSEEQTETPRGPFTILVSASGEVSFDPPVLTATTWYTDCRDGWLYICFRRQGSEVCRRTNRRCFNYKYAKDKDLEVEEIPFSIHVDENGNVTFDPDVPGATERWFEGRDGRVYACWRISEGIVGRKINIPWGRPSDSEAQA